MVINSQIGQYHHAYFTDDTLKMVYESDLDIPM